MPNVAPHTNGFKLIRTTFLGMLEEFSRVRELMGGTEIVEGFDDRGGGGICSRFLPNWSFPQSAIAEITTITRNRRSQPRRRCHFNSVRPSLAAAIDVDLKHTPKQKRNQQNQCGAAPRGQITGTLRKQAQFTVARSHQNQNESSCGRLPVRGGGILASETSLLYVRFWCKKLKRSVSCDNGRDDGTDLGTGSLQRALSNGSSRDSIRCVAPSLPGPDA